MTVCCFGRENDHRHRGEQCFCERHREREIQSTSSFPNETGEDDRERETNFQIFPVKKTSREGGRGGRRPPSRDVFRRAFPRAVAAAVVVSRSLDVKLSSTFANWKNFLTFTDFPSNVCVVPMLAFFVYARFFLPTVTTVTTRRRLGRRRPTRGRFRHTVRDASSENETTTTTTKKKKKRKEFLRERREKKGKKNVPRFVVRRERKKRVKAFFSCEDKRKKKRKKKEHDDVSKTYIDPTFTLSRNPNQKNKKKQKKRERERREPKTLDLIP